MTQLDLFFEQPPAGLDSGVPEVHLVPIAWLERINSVDGDNLRQVFNDHDDEDDWERIVYLKEEFQFNGFDLGYPVCVVYQGWDYDGWVISDGHHRLHALDDLGVTHAPVYFCDEEEASSSQSLKSPLPDHVGQYVPLEILRGELANA